MADENKFTLRLTEEEIYWLGDAVWLARVSRERALDRKVSERDIYFSLTKKIKQSRIEGGLER